MGFIGGKGKGQKTQGTGHSSSVSTGGNTKSGGDSRTGSAGKGSSSTSGKGAGRGGDSSDNTSIGNINIRS